MRDIALSDDDRKRLVLLLAQLFPDNESASKLLDLVRYPNRRWPGFTEKPIEGWQETLRDFDESGPDETPYSELLIGIKRIYPAEIELALLANRYHAETRITQQRPSVLVIGADEGRNARSRWSRELSVIQQAHQDGYVNVQVCSATMLDPDQVGRLNPEYVHVNGQGDGKVIRFDDGTTVPADQLVNCIDQSITNDRVMIRGIVLDGGRNGQQLFGKFRPIAEYVAMHDGDVTDELGVRFAEKLYQLLQLAPRFEAAVNAAHHFVFQQRYGSTGNHGMILCWAAPQDDDRAGSSRQGATREIFARRPDTRADLSFSPEDLDVFEGVLISLYQSDPVKSRKLMRSAGFPLKLQRELIGGSSVNWNRAFIELENGLVLPEQTPFRRLLEWVSKDCPGNAELRRLAEKYLAGGGSGL
jgi:hypothetical protein